MSSALIPSPVRAEGRGPAGTHARRVTLDQGEWRRWPGNVRGRFRSRCSPLARRWGRTSAHGVTSRSLPGRDRARSKCGTATRATRCIGWRRSTPLKALPPVAFPRPALPVRVATMAAAWVLAVTLAGSPGLQGGLGRPVVSARAGRLSAIGSAAPAGRSPWASSLGGAAFKCRRPPAGAFQTWLHCSPVFPRFRAPGCFALSRDKSPGHPPERTRTCTNCPPCPRGWSWCSRWAISCRGAPMERGPGACR